MDFLWILNENNETNVINVINNKHKFKKLLNK